MDKGPDIALRQARLITGSHAVSNQVKYKEKNVSFDDQINNDFFA